MISRFREVFIKTGALDPWLGDVCGRVMDNRVRSDYDMLMNLDIDMAKKDIADASRFVHEVEEWLKQQS